VNTDGDVWYLITLSNNLPAWVSQYVAARVNDAPLGEVAMAATVPPSPTLSPTPTPTNTPTVTPTPIPSPTPVLPPGANGRVYAGSRVNLRSGPDQTYDSLGLLEPSAPLAVLGRNDAGTWVQANTFDGRSGWLLSQLVDAASFSLAALPVTWSGPPIPNGLIFDASVIAQARQIYARGQQLGNQTARFIVIGDSIIANTPEWAGIFTSIRNNTYTLGSFTELQTTIDFYRPGNSFGADFQTARAGYATRYILDPTWADPEFCEKRENVLTCEIRRSRPAFAIIYIGHIDMQGKSTSGYAENLDTIVQTLMNAGIIPVLNTVAYSEAAVSAINKLEWMAYMNTTIKETAARYNLPVVDFQSLAAQLPNNGCIPDGRHLTYGVDGVVNFNGDQHRYGKDLRELMNLQMMEALRVYVFQR
ncbi:MAG: SH3 domain-containing protein, partial [Anaerolineae bacterium]|nr:SH3 domain-containing protein [Anaerolineae bacterium]